MNNIISIINKIKETQSTKSKISILEDNKDNELLVKVLEYTYNPDKKYGISEKVLTQITSKQFNSKSDKNIFELLDILAEKNINDKLRYEIAKFYSSNLDMWDLYSKMILKDLRCNISLKTILKVFPNIIHQHNVMLASKFEGKLDGKVAITTKLDGIRASILINNGNIKIISRQGKEFIGLNELKDVISKSNIDNMFIDGELLLTNENNLSSDDLFRATTQVVNSKDKNKTGVRFVVFDVCSYDDYINQVNNKKYLERRKLLEIVVEKCNSSLVEIVQIYDITDDINNIYKLLDEVTGNGYEGLMLNYLDKCYEFKRSKSILKCKKFSSIDVLVKDIEEGSGANNGKLGAIIIDYKGNSVGVGSGFSLDERELYWNNKELLLGKIVEIKYFEESKNKDGKISLRFPTWIGRIREDKTQPSYN